MKKSLRFLFIILIILFSYHLMRDVLQIVGIQNILTQIDLVYRDHYWCKPYCDYVSIPPEVFGIIGSSIVLNRGKIGAIGIAVLASLVFWPFAIFLP
jgi:hypothetical protein